MHDEMAELGAKLMIEVLDDFENIKPTPQDEALVTYAHKIDKAEAKLDFNQPAEILERKIRAFNPYPATYFEYEGERFKILEATAEKEPCALGIGEIVYDDKTIKISCQDGSLNVIKIQREGKKATSAHELLRRYKF